MRNMLKKATGLILSAALTFSLAAPAAAGGSSSAAGGLVRRRNRDHPSPAGLAGPGHLPRLGRVCGRYPGREQPVQL